MHKFIFRSGLICIFSMLVLGCASTIEGVKSDIGKVGQKAGIIKSEDGGTQKKLLISPKQKRISEIQSKLADLGYYSGDIDGNFDAATEAAIQDYQLDNGLRIDGRPTEKLREALAQ